MRQRSNQWHSLCALLAGLVIVVIDSTVLNVALKTIQLELGADQSEAIWAVNAYVLAFGATLFSWGVLADRFGRRKLLICGLIIFGLGSLAAAFATSPLSLIAARVLMGVGGAAVLPISLAIITVTFAPQTRGKAVGVWVATMGAAVAAGPLIGGLLLTWFWWGSIFLINVPLVVVGVVGVLAFVSESKNDHERPLDVLGLVLSVVGLVLVVFGIQRISDTHDVTDLTVLVPFLVGLIILVGFLLQQRRSQYPSIDLALLRTRAYSFSLVGVTLTYAMMTGVVLFMTYYLQSVRELSPLQAGACIVPLALGQLLTSPFAQRLATRIGARSALVLGMLLAASVFAGAALVAEGTPIAVIVSGYFLLGVALGVVMTVGTTQMTLATPTERAGVGSSMQSTVRQVGSTIGVAVISSILAVAYSAQLAASRVVGNLPSQVLDELENSIGSAQSALQSLPDTAGTEALEQAVANSFVSAIHTVSIVAAAVVALGALMVFLRLTAATPSGPLELQNREPQHE